MEICNGDRAGSDPHFESVGLGCRGFAGLFRLDRDEGGRARLPTALTCLERAWGSDRPPHSTPALALWAGPSSIRIQSANQQRVLVVTGGGRHGAARKRASQALAPQGDPAVLLDLGGGLGCAFAMHDKSAGTLLLGRDAMGVMPLYVSIRADRIAFATEIGSFAALLDERPQIDGRVLAMYLDHGFNGGNRTALARVERVMPGELLRIGRDLRITRTYRRARLGATGGEGPDLSGACQRFDALFEPTVASSIDPQRPSSLLLSGGLDSALICSALSKASDSPLQTIAVAYDFTQVRDELADAKRISALFGTRHSELRLSREALWQRIAWMVWRTDELMDDPAALPTSLVSGRLPRDRAIFTGEGADDVFAGDGCYRRKAFQRYFSSLIAPGSGGWRSHGLWSAHEAAALFGEDLRETRRARREDIVTGWASTPREWSWLKRAQGMELASVFPNTLALKVGRSLDDAQASVRMPFLDPAIVHFGLSLDDRLKVRGRVGKYFLREWASSRLPRDHVMKRKRGFHAPVGHLLQGDYLAQLEPVLMASTLVSRWFRPAGVARLFAEQRATGRRSQALWRLLHLAIWLSLFVLRPGVTPTRREDPLAWIL